MDQMNVIYEDQQIQSGVLWFFQVEKWIPFIDVSPQLRERPLAINIDEILLFYFRTLSLASYRNNRSMKNHHESNKPQ